MRLALAQLNPTVGAIEANAARIIDAIDQAAAHTADLLLTAELALTGYPPKDLLLHEGFLADAWSAWQRIAAHTAKHPSLTVAVGMPVANDRSPDALPFNAICIAQQGQHSHTYHKRLLPTYDVFDENRYFTSGSQPIVIPVADHRVGLSICEDLWKGHDVGFAQRYITSPDPAEELVAAGATCIVNPSASPFVLGKRAEHLELLRSHAIKHNVAVASVNQVGGNDELIFDGHAVALDHTGAIINTGQLFHEGITYADVPPPGSPADTPAHHDATVDDSDVSQLFHALVLGVRDYCRKTGFSSVVLGLSGGIDSAVTCAIAAAALGPDNVLGIAMPSRYSSPGSITDAQALASNLNIGFQTIPIDPPFQAIESTLDPAFAALGVQPDQLRGGVTEENLQSRIRGLTLMAVSNKLGHLLLTTGNKSELAVGYCTLYGDMNGGLAVLSDVTKQYVYKLARWINDHPDALGTPPPNDHTAIPESTITKPPSAELRPDQLDRDSLPDYDILDEIIARYVEQRQHPLRITSEMGIAQQTVSRIVRMIDVNEHKRKQLAIGLKVSSVAFGSGRRHPIAQAWNPAWPPAPL